MGVKLFGSFNDLPKLRMWYPTDNRDHDRPIHFVGYDLADPSFPKMPLRKFRLLRLRSRRRGSTFRMHSLLIHFTNSLTSQRAAQAAAAWYGLRWSAIAFWKAGRASQRS